MRFHQHVANKASGALAHRWLLLLLHVVAVVAVVVVVVVGVIDAFSHGHAKLCTPDMMTCI